MDEAFLFWDCSDIIAAISRHGSCLTNHK